MFAELGFLGDFFFFFFFFNFVICFFHIGAAFFYFFIFIFFLNGAGAALRVVARHLWVAIGWLEARERQSEPGDQTQARLGKAG